MLQGAPREATHFGFHTLLLELIAAPCAFLSRRHTEELAAAKKKLDSEACEVVENAFHGLIVCLLGHPFSELQRETKRKSSIFGVAPF